MTPEFAAAKLAQLAKRIAWSPHSGLEPRLRMELKNAVQVYTQATQRKTAFAHVLKGLDDDDIGGSLARCAYSKCGVPMPRFQHKRRKYHTAECRKKAFYERKKNNPVDKGQK